MARKRMIDPEFFIDEKLAEVSANARLLFIALWTIADDNFGTLPNRPKWIKTQSFPYEDVDIAKLVSELCVHGLISMFTHEDCEYLYIKHFHKHQRIEKPSKPKYPCYDKTNDITPHLLPESSPTTPAEEKRREEKGKEEKRSEETKIASPVFEEKEGKQNPTFSEVRDQIANGMTFKATRGISKAWQEEAFRYADGLKIKLDSSQMGRWLKFFKDAHTIRPQMRPKIQIAFTYLSDLHAFTSLEDSEAKIKFFWEIAYNGTESYKNKINNFQQQT